MVERIYRIGKMKKTIQTVFIFVVLYSFMACTTDHSFTLDEKRQIIVVHNLLILEIESDSTQIDDGHLFFITKKDPYETRITDTIRLQGTTTEISVKCLSILRHFPMTFTSLGEKILVFWCFPRSRF